MATDEKQAAQAQDGEGAGRLQGLVTRSRVRRFALDYAAATGRGNVVKRVGESVYFAAEMAVRRTVKQLVRSHPSAFRTLEA